MANLFDEILIANRGIIATRVIETCTKLGIKTVSVYTLDDIDSLHVKNADESIPIRRYTEMAELLQVAEHLKTVNHHKIGVHPGYGFLAEDAEFALICDEHFKFIGPSFEVIELLGDKIEAIKSAQEAGVPVNYGSRDEVCTEKQAFKVARKEGFPILIKAAAGGGGMGMKLVNEEKDLIKSYREIRSFAKSQNYSSNRIYFERFLKDARHIEVQIIADNYGNVVCLGERDCSIQRRNQKLIEFSPADISYKLRNDLYEASVALAKRVGYTSAGTVEFLIDSDDNFYFMEVNTRIQVEHRVSELRTGIDIVEEQLRIASGERLRYSQEDIRPEGFSLECRINAEDPDNDFYASVGRIKKFKKPEGDGIIVDTYIDPDLEYTISAQYDSLIANVIVLGEDKKEAVDKMSDALKQFVIKGSDVKTTIPYHQKRIREL